MQITPTFFDHFGFVIWIFLFYVACKDIRDSVIEVKWPRFIVLLISVIGIILDGTLLFLEYSGSELVEYAWMFDHLGIPVFVYLIWLSLTDLKKKISRPLWTKWALVVIGFAGLIADGFILYGVYF